MPTRPGHPITEAPTRQRWPLALLATLAGGLGVATIWVTVALATDRGCGWMALVGAVDFALLLRLVRMPPGPRRVALAVAATVLTAAASAWLVAAGQIGSMLGLYPLESALRMGPVLGWELVQRFFEPWDWACMAFSPLLAAMCAWSRRR